MGTVAQEQRIHQMLNIEQLGIYVREAAARMTRKEVAAMQRAAKRATDSDRDGWEAVVREFYAGHVGLVQQTLHIPRPAAQAYCDGQVLTVTEDRHLPWDAWAAWSIDTLSDLAMTNMDKTPLVPSEGDDDERNG